MKRAMARSVVKFLRREDGPTAVEYAILLALIVTICVGVMSHLNSNTGVVSTNAPATIALTGN